MVELMTRIHRHESREWVPLDSRGEVLSGLNILLVHVSYCAPDLAAAVVKSCLNPFITFT